MEPMKAGGKCPRCGAEVIVNVNLLVTIPYSMYGNLSKRNMAKKEVKVLGAYWPETSFFCPKGDWFYEREVKSN